jgi:hypothetical protein
VSGICEQNFQCAGHRFQCINVRLWDSLEAIRASENYLFLTQAISRFLACCDGLPHISEQELLVSDFIATSTPAKT